MYSMQEYISRTVFSVLVRHSPRLYRAQPTWPQGATMTPYISCFNPSLLSDLSTQSIICGRPQPGQPGANHRTLGRDSSAPGSWGVNRVLELISLQRGRVRTTALLYNCTNKIQPSTAVKFFSYHEQIKFVHTGNTKV